MHVLFFAFHLHAFDVAGESSAFHKGLSSGHERWMWRRGRRSGRNGAVTRRSAVINCCVSRLPVALSQTGSKAVQARVKPGRGGARSCVSDFGRGRGARGAPLPTPRRKRPCRCCPGPWAGESLRTGISRGSKDGPPPEFNPAFHPGVGTRIGEGCGGGWSRSHCVPPPPPPHWPKATLPPHSRARTRSYGANERSAIKGLEQSSFSYDVFYEGGLAKNSG